MATEWNPYEPPEASDQQDTEFELSRFQAIFKNRGDVLRKTLEERSRQGWHLVTSFHVGSNDYYLVWKRRNSEDPAETSGAQYRILPLPGFIEAIRTRSFGAWTPAIADQLASLSNDWAFKAFFPPVGYVLRNRTAIERLQSVTEKYSVIVRRPVWWRTMFGNSWIRILCEELNNDLPHNTRIVSYLDQDNFLIRFDQRSDRQTEVDAVHRRRTCRIVIWPQWKSMLYSRTPSIGRWFAEQAANGWELLSQHHGAVFLFAASAERTDTNDGT